MEAVESRVIGMVCTPICLTLLLPILGVAAGGVGRIATGGQDYQALFWGLSNSSDFVLTAGQECGTKR